MGAKSKTCDPEVGFLQRIRSMRDEKDGSNSPIHGDWESKLDENTSIWLFDGRTLETAGLAQMHQPPALTNIFLLEGLSMETVAHLTNYSGFPEDSRVPGLDKTFFYHHFLDCLPDGAQEAASNSYFFKWCRRTLQERRLWDIETRIAAGKPYDSETLRNPADIGLDHEEYKRHPRICRPYDFLEPQLKPNGNSLPDPTSHPGHIRHAARECCSFAWTRTNGKFIGFLVFDAPRKYITIQKKYRLGVEQPSEQATRELCFADDPTTRERFARALDRIDQIALAEDPELVIQNIILQFIRDDYLSVLSNARDTLEFIDFAMSNDNVLHDCVSDWRVLFGNLRTELSRSERSISDLIEFIRYHGASVIEQESGHTVDTEAEFCLNKKVQAVRTRAESTFQALMSTMSIVESQKAIVQAETISKLTSLAFFFIPLTLSASLFGMNIVEWTGHLKIWLWATVSITLTGSTYLLLFRQPIWHTMQKTPAYLRSINRRRAVNGIKRFSLVFYSHIKLLLLDVSYFILLALCLVPAAGVGVAFWAYFTKTHMSLAKIAAFMFLFGVGAYIAVLPFYLLVVHRIQPT